MRDTRREVRDKWQTILENLGKVAREMSRDVAPACFHSNQGLPSSAGFMAEAESLLNVSAGASHDRMRNAPAARAMLKKLHNETSIFSTKEPPPERYLFILVRSDSLYSTNIRLGGQGRRNAFEMMRAPATLLGPDTVSVHGRSFCR